MRDLRKTLTLLVFMLVCCLPAHSQRQDSFWGKIVNLISAPSMELDPSAVYQPAPCWNIAVSGALNQVGTTMDYKMEYIYTFEDDVEGGSELLDASSTFKLSGGYDHYNYRGATAVPEYFSDDEIEFDNIQSSGCFSRWNASLKLGVKF